MGVCGSIAAYKACEVVRGLSRAGVEVRVVLTASAARFVAPLTFAVLSRGPVHEDAFDPRAWDMAHLSLAAWAERVVVAPATADFIARLAAGRAGGLLEALLLSTRAPAALCPAMDAGMWEHPATRENVERLKRRGCDFWGPERGPLASGKTGLGRLLAPEKIVARTLGLPQLSAADPEKNDRRLGEG